MWISFDFVHCMQDCKTRRLLVIFRIENILQLGVDSAADVPGFSPEPRKMP